MATLLRVVDVDSTKPSADKKSYRVVVLQCGLRALLISDPSAAPTNDDDDAMSDGSGSKSSRATSEAGSDASSDSGSDGGDDDGKSDDGARNRNGAIAFAIGVGSWADPPYVARSVEFSTASRPRRTVGCSLPLSLPPVAHITPSSSHICVTAETACVA